MLGVKKLSAFPRHFTRRVCNHGYKMSSGDIAVEGGIMEGIINAIKKRELPAEKKTLLESVMQNLLFRKGRSSVHPKVSAT